MLRLTFVLLALGGVRMESVQVERIGDDRLQSGVNRLFLGEEIGTDEDTQRSKREFLYRTPIEEDIGIDSEEFTPREIRKRCNPVHRQNSFLFDDSDTLHRLIDLLNEERSVHRSLNRRRSYTRDLEEPVTSLTIPGSTDEEAESDLPGSDFDLEPIAYKLAMAEKKNRLRSRECDHKRMICYCQDEDCTNPERSGIVRLSLPKQPFSLRKKPKRIGFKDRIKPTKGSYLDHLNSIQNLPVLVPVAHDPQSKVMNAMQYIPIHENPKMIDFANEEENEPEKYHIPFAVSHPDRPGYLVGSVQVMSQDRQQGKKYGMQVGQPRRKCSGNKSKNNNKHVYGEQRSNENVGSTFENRKQEETPELFEFEECMKHHTADVCMLASAQRAMSTEHPVSESDQNNANTVSHLVGATQNYDDSAGSQGNFQGGVTQKESNGESSSLRPEVEQKHYAPYHTSYEVTKDRNLGGGGHEVLPADSGNLAKAPYKGYDASRMIYANDYETYERSNAEGGTSRNLDKDKSKEGSESKINTEVPKNDAGPQESPTMSSNIHEVTNGYFTSREFENETDLTGMDAEGNKIVHYNELNLSNPTAHDPNKNEHQPHSTEVQPKNSVVQQNDSSSTQHDPTFVKNLIKKVINDIALNRSETVGDVMHIKNLNERLHPSFRTIPNLRHMILSPPLERTVINRVNNHMTQLMDAKRRLPTHQIRKYLHHVVNGPEAGKNPHFVVEEHQLNQGTWSPRKVNLLQQDSANKPVEPATRLRDRVMYFLNNPMHRGTINHPVAKNMIAESVKNDMAEENQDTGVINDKVISRFLDKIFGVPDNDQKRIIVQPRPEVLQNQNINNGESNVIDADYDERPQYEDEDDVVSSRQNLNEQEVVGSEAKVVGGDRQQSREKEIGVLRKDQSTYEANSNGKEHSTTEFPTSGNFDRKSSVTEQSVRMSTYRDEEKVDDQKSKEISRYSPRKGKDFESSTSGVAEKLDATTCLPVAEYNKLAASADLDGVNFSTRRPNDEDEKSQDIETAPIKYYSPEGRKLEYVKTHAATPENENTESPILAKKVSEPSTENLLYLPTEGTKAVGKAQTLTKVVSESEPILDSEQKEDNRQTLKTNDVVQESPKASVNSDDDDKKSVFTENSTSESRYDVGTKTTEAIKGDEEKSTTVRNDPIEVENKRLTNVVTHAQEKKFDTDEKTHIPSSGNLNYAGPSTENTNESHVTFADKKSTKSEPEAESEPTETSDPNVKMENPTQSWETEGEHEESKGEVNKNLFTESPIVKNDEVSEKPEEIPVQPSQIRYTSVDYIPAKQAENVNNEVVAATLGSESDLNEGIHSASSTPSGRLTTEIPSHVHTERIPVEESVVQEVGRTPDDNLENRERMLHYERNKYAQSPTARAQYDASMASHPSTIPHYQERLTSVYYTPSRRLPENSENIHRVEMERTNAPDARSKVPETEFGSRYYTTPSLEKAKLGDTTMLADREVTSVPEQRESTQTEKVFTSEPATIIIKNFSPTSTMGSIVYEHQITDTPNLLTSGHPHTIQTYEPKISGIVTNEEVLPITHNYPTQHAHEIYDHYPSSTSRVETEKSQTLYYTSSPYEKTPAPVVTLTVRHETHPEIEEMTENPKPTFATERSVEEASRRPINYNEAYKDASMAGRSQFEVTERTPSPELGPNYKVTVYYSPTEKVSENTQTKSTSTRPTRYRPYTDKYSTSPTYVIGREMRVTENPQNDGTRVEPEGRVTQTGRIVSEEQKISPPVTESSVSLSEDRVQMQAGTRRPITSSETVTQISDTDRFGSQILGLTQIPEIAKTDQQLPIVYYSPTEGKYHVVENSVTGKPTDGNENVFTIREMVDKANANAHRTTVSTDAESSKVSWRDGEVKPTEHILPGVQLIENSTPSLERMSTQGQTQEAASTQKDKDVTFGRTQTIVTSGNENLSTTKIPGHVMPIVYYSPSEQKYKLYNDPGTTEGTKHSKDSTAEIMYTSDYDRRYTSRPFESTNFPRTMSTQEETTDFRSRVDQVPGIQTGSHLKDETATSVSEHSASNTERSLTRESEEPIDKSYDSTSKKTFTNDRIVGESQGDVRPSTESSRIYGKSTIHPTNPSTPLNPFLKDEILEPKDELTDLAVKKGDLKSNYYTTTFLEGTSTPGTIRSEKENTEVLPDVGELGQNEKDLVIDDRTQRVTTEHSTPVMESVARNDEVSKVSNNYERVTEPSLRQMSTEARYKMQSTSKTPLLRYQSTTSGNEKSPTIYHSTTEGILKYTQSKPLAEENAEIIENLPGENKGKVYETHIGSAYQTISPVQKANARQMIISEDKEVEETKPEVGQTGDTKTVTVPKENMQTSFPQSSTLRHEVNERIMTDSPIVAETRSPELTKELTGEISEIYLPTEKELGDSTKFETTTEDFAYFGRISLANEDNPPKELSDLQSSDLYYIGDGVKLPLEIRRLKDGSYALSISSKICKNFMKKECPCCVPRNGKILRTKRAVRGKRSSRNSLELAMPVSSFAKQYNLVLDIAEQDRQPSRGTGNHEMLLEEKNDEKLNDLTDREHFVTEVFKVVEEEGSGEDAEESLGHRYDVNNPFLGRSRFVKKVQGEHTQTRGQRSDRGYYADRMEDMRHFLHWLKALILASD